MQDLLLKDLLKYLRIFTLLAIVAIIFVTCVLNLLTYKEIEMSKDEIRSQINKVLDDESGNSHWNHLDQVYPGIYIGDEFAAKDIDTLKRLGITHILNVAFVSSRTDFYDHGIVETDPDWYTEKNYNCEFLGIDAIDNPEFDLSQFFEDAADFIESARSTNGKVLVHCYVGLSRSATLVIVYLMIKKNMRAKEAIALIREKRAIYPNSGFIDQVIDLELQLRGG